MRCRLAHDGAVGDGWLPPQFFDPVEAGGGALVDLGCHPVYLTRLFLGGMPETVSAVYGHVTGRAVEDNAVVTMRHATGAVAIAETGFVTPRSPFSIEDQRDDRQSSIRRRAAAPVGSRHEHFAR